MLERVWKYLSWLADKFQYFWRCENAVLCPGWLGKWNIVCYLVIPVFLSGSKYKSREAFGVIKGILLVSRIAFTDNNIHLFLASQQGHNLLETSHFLYDWRQMLQNFTSSEQSMSMPNDIIFLCWLETSHFLYDWHQILQNFTSSEQSTAMQNDIILCRLYSAFQCSMLPSCYSRKS